MEKHCMNRKSATTHLRHLPFTFFALLGLLTSFPVWAEVITDESIEIQGTFFYNDLRSTNRFFYYDEPLALIGGFVSPSPDTDRQSTDPTFYGDDTTASIFHESGLTYSTPYSGPTSDLEAGITSGTGSANLFFSGNLLSAFADNDLLSGWSLNASNSNIDGGTPVSADIRDLDPTLTPELVTNAAINGDPTAPALSWSQPDDSIHNAQSIYIWRTDLVDENGDARPPVLLHIEKIGSETTGYELPTNLNLNIAGNETLDPNGQYLFAVQLDVIDQEIFDAQVLAGENTIENYPLLGRSRSFFEFTTTATSPDGSPVYLPSVDEEGVFHFNIDVVNGEVVFIDPVVAIGYDYAVGFGDPLFASFILPEIGDDIFELHLFDILLDEFYFEDFVYAGFEYVFDTAVSMFRILGIETGAALDPSDPTAFITGLTFDGSGSFTGTMTAITKTVPEPGSIALFALGLMALGTWRRKQSSFSS